MNRRAWRILLGVALFAAVAMVALNIGRRTSLESMVDPARFAMENLPELLQRIRNFDRVITREGRKVLEVSATEASYYKNDRAVEVVEPKVIFYEKGEVAGEVTAERGRLYLDGMDVQGVEVVGAVRFEIGRLRLTSENLSYDRSTNRILVRGTSRIDAAELTLSGTDLSIDMLEGSGVMAGNVHMVMRATPAETPGEPGDRQ